MGHGHGYQHWATIKRGPNPSRSLTCGRGCRGDTQPFPAGSGHGLASPTGQWPRASPEPPCSQTGGQSCRPAHCPAQPRGLGVAPEALCPRRMPLAGRGGRNPAELRAGSPAAPRQAPKALTRTRSPPFPVQLLLFLSPGARSWGSADGLANRCRGSAPARAAQPRPAAALRNSPWLPLHLPGPRAPAAPPVNNMTGDANSLLINFEPGRPRSRCLRFVSDISRDISRLSCCKLRASRGCSAHPARGEPSPRSLAQPQTLLSLCPGVGAQTGQNFELQQPQDKVSVAAGDTLTLTCTTSGDSPLGPVKWLKGWGSGNKTVYGQTGSFPRVTRVVSGSNTDFSIHISDVRPEDAGTYYCVKFSKWLGGEEVFQHGKGTEVSLHDAALVPSMVAAAVMLFLLLLLGLFIAFCMYRRKHRGEADSQCLAGPAAAGSFLPIPPRCCGGTPSTPSEIRDSETSHLPSQQSSKEDNNIHYADLQPLPAAPRHGRSPGAVCSEYASIRVAAK
ncbi:uncharacterized protein LOC141931470 isoform X2 [Strix aluco]|uniref:uncharacterized protein LOC141931470 isoform X2 n=1 Tax=Strix aluco TaxID=111821 RepID=UPI003DA54ABC